MLFYFNRAQYITIICSCHCQFYFHTYRFHVLPRRQAATVKISFCRTPNINILMAGMYLLCLWIRQCASILTQTHHISNYCVRLFFFFICMHSCVRACERVRVCASFWMIYLNSSSLENPQTMARTAQISNNASEAQFRNA